MGRGPLLITPCPQASVEHPEIENSKLINSHRGKIYSSCFTKTLAIVREAEISGMCSNSYGGGRAG